MSPSPLKVRKPLTASFWNVRFLWKTGALPMVVEELSRARNNVMVSRKFAGTHWWSTATLFYGPMLRLKGDVILPCLDLTVGLQNHVVYTRQGVCWSTSFQSQSWKLISSHYAENGAEWIQTLTISPLSTWSCRPDMNIQKTVLGGLCRLSLCFWVCWQALAVASPPIQRHSR